MTTNSGIPFLLSTVLLHTETHGNDTKLAVIIEDIMVRFYLKTKSSNTIWYFKILSLYFHFVSYCLLSTIIYFFFKVKFSTLEILPHHTVSFVLFFLLVFVIHSQASAIKRISELEKGNNDHMETTYKQTLHTFFKSNETIFVCS